MKHDVDTLGKFGQSFQSKVISALLVDNKLLDTVSEIMDVRFFESSANQWIVGVILDYHAEYKKPPTMDVFKVELTKIQEDEILKKTVVDQLRHVYTKVGNIDLDYIKEQFTSFCKNQNLKRVIIESVDLLADGNYDRIQEMVDSAMKVGIESDLGHDYVEDFEDRNNIQKRDTVPTKWNVLNELMDGGLGPGELGVVVAPSGAGKSWLLSIIGAAAVEAGKTVVHYTLELNEVYVGKRYDTIFTGIPHTELDDREEEVKQKINSLEGRLRIKYFPPKGINYKKLENHVEKMVAAGNKPDLIIVDYADLLLSKSKGGDSTYAEQGGIYVELRGLSGEQDIPIWTASQSSRSSLEDDVIEAGKIADSYAKVMHSDFIISLSRKSNDKLANTARIHVMKNRFGPDGMTFPSKMDTNTGQVDIFEQNSAQGIAVQKASENGNHKQKQKLYSKLKQMSGDTPKKTPESSLG